tara:strand:+ start:120 stop:1025 length:906 start_codon:yes stop_codon:yes gene_type:complete
MSLLIIGTVAFDGIETPYGKVNKILGGSATYIGIASSYFNKKSNLISVVGGDFPRDNINLLISHGINCDGLEIRKNEKTFYWAGKYHVNMNLRDTLATHLNVLENFEPKIPDNYQDCTYLMLANLMPSIQLDAIQQLHTKPKLVVTDTMNYWMDNYLSDLHIVVSKTDVLIINDEEALQLSSSNNLIDAAAKIQTMGPKFVIIKKGEQGAILFGNNQSFSCSAFNSLKCIDPTGAGDTFAGAFIGYLHHTNDVSFSNMKKGVIRACAMASFCVENFGVQNIINQTHQDIQERVVFLEKNNL